MISSSEILKKLYCEVSELCQSPQMSVLDQFRFPLVWQYVDFRKWNHVIAIQFQWVLSHLTPRRRSQSYHEEHDASTHFRIPTFALIATEAELPRKPRSFTRVIVGTPESGNSNRAPLVADVRLLSGQFLQPQASLRFSANACRINLARQTTPSSPS